jgi:anti-sigma factor RsiW
MDQRIESFLSDVLALEGETPDAIREAVRAALADCEAIFRAQEANKRMKEKAAHACHSLCRGRVAEEMRRRKGTTAGDHLQFVLSVIDGPKVP